MSNDLDRLLKSLLGNDDKSGKEDGDDDDCLPMSEQKALLEGLLEKPVSFKVGDYVKRNKYGKKRYKFPKDEDVAMVTHVLVEPKMETDATHSDMVHGEITTVKTLNGKPHLVATCVNFRYFDLVSSAPKVRSEKDED